MTDDKKLENKEAELTDEELDNVAGGMVNVVNIVKTVPSTPYMPQSRTPQETEKSNPFPQNCG